MSTRWMALSLGAAVCAGCAFDLPKEAPALADMEEPLALREAPRDEEARQRLPMGGFTGVYVVEGQTRLDQRDEESEGVRVERIVENSPGDAAGLAAGDLVYEVEVEGRGRVPISWPSEWRALELEALPGARWTVRFDRAGAEKRAELSPVPRVHPADAPAVEHFREEQHVGVVLRTASEVEARAAGLGPGGGAVVIGLSRRSPWRKAGVRFEDLLVEIAGRPAAHPQVVLEEIRRTGEEHEPVELLLVRDGQRLELEALSSVRYEEVGELTIPLLYSFERERGRVEHSVLLGLVGFEMNEVAYRWRFLWLISFTGGQADRLVEVDG